MGLVQPKTRHDRKSHEPSLDVALGSKLQAAGLLHPGSAHASVAGAKSIQIPRAIVRQPRRDQKEFAAMEEWEDFESRVYKQLMISCFVFELDKIRKKTHEGSFLAHEQVILLDEAQTLCPEAEMRAQKKATPVGMAFLLNVNELGRSTSRLARPYLVRRLLKSRTLGVAMKMEL